MRVREYDEFVTRTDQYKERSAHDRWVIALYGLVGEIGSVYAAIKKKLLAEDGQSSWNKPNAEIIEEIGDVIWYCFSVAQLANPSNRVNVLVSDIALLKREIGNTDARAKKIRAALDPAKRETFIKAAKGFPSTQDMTFDDYQRLAFLTARTQGRDLLEVCLAVLWQLGAELLRTTLPEIELTLNQNVEDRSSNVVLGEIAWHLCAVASLMGISMDDVVARNLKKVQFRSDRSTPTPLHVQDFPVEDRPIS